MEKERDTRDESRLDKVMGMITIAFATVIGAILMLFQRRPKRQARAVEVIV